MTAHVAAPTAPRVGVTRLLRIATLVACAMFAFDFLRFAVAIAFPLSGVPVGFWGETFVVEWIAAATLVLAVWSAARAVDAGLASPRLGYAFAIVVAAAAATVIQHAMRHGLELRIGAPAPGIRRAFDLRLDLDSGAEPEVAAMQPWFLFSQLVLRSSLLVLGWLALRDAWAAGRRARDAELRAARGLRETAATRLQAAQARVEPAMLFATLAHVGERLDEDPEAAAGALDELIAYLRAVLPRAEEPLPTLGHEVDLAGAWVTLLRRRRRGRVDWQPCASDAAATQPMPAFAILPLVAAACGNAERDMAVTLRADLHGGILAVQIETTDHEAEAALRDTAAVVTARLAAALAAPATLTVRRTAIGACACLELPCP